MSGDSCSQVMLRGHQTLASWGKWAGQTGGEAAGAGRSVAAMRKMNYLDIPILESDILRLYGHFFTPPPGHHYFSNRFFRLGHLTNESVQNHGTNQIFTY